MLFIMLFIVALVFHQRDLPAGYGSSLYVASGVARTSTRKSLYLSSWPCPDFFPQVLPSPRVTWTLED